MRENPLCCQLIILQTTIFTDLPSLFRYFSFEAEFAECFEECLVANRLHVVAARIHQEATKSPNQMWWEVTL